MTQVWKIVLRRARLKKHGRWCLKGRLCFQPESPQDAKPLMLHLHVLVTFTSTSSWRVLKDKSCEALRPVLTQLCCNVGGHLVSKGGLYGALQALLLRGLARAKPALKRASLMAVTNLALR